MRTSEHHRRHHMHSGYDRRWVLTLYIAVVVTITLVLMSYQYARYGHL